MKACAGIVLYDPDVERLKLSVEAVRAQVDRVVFVDNSSDKAGELQDLFVGEQFYWIKNEKNHGIAKALNQLVEFADRNGYEWILTLDQDSICEDGLVQRMLTVIEGEGGATGIAMVSPVIVDRDMPDVDGSSGNQLNDIEDVKFCITSGCLTNVKAVSDIGGFNEWLFIYDVDREICIRLLRRGYRLVRVVNSRLYHEHGTKTVYRKILWKKVVYHNYSPFSVYYMTRNLVYMLRKYGSEYTPLPFFRWMRLFFAFCVKFIFEPDRIQRLKAFTRGLREGLAVDVRQLMIND